jgi:hypothetical protein
MKTLFLKLPEMFEVEFSVECLPEDSPPEGHFASGDDDFDRAQVEEILRDLKWNEWAWCTVKVSAKWRNFCGRDYLGGCSYSSKQDFCEGGYFEDMKAEAFDDLIRGIENSCDGVIERGGK